MDGKSLCGLEGGCGTLMDRGVNGFCVRCDYGDR